MVLEELNKAVGRRMKRNPAEGYRESVNFIYRKYEDYLLQEAKRMEKCGDHKRYVALRQMNMYMGWARLQSLEGKVDVSPKYLSSFISKNKELRR